MGRRAEQVMKGAIEDGGEALALVLDGARGHDGGHGAGVGGEQRDESFAVETDGAHHAIGDERGAGEIAGVFQDADEEEEQQDLRQEDEHGLHAVPKAVAQQQAQPVIGKQQRGLGARVGEQQSEAVGERLAEREDDLEDREDDGEEDERAGDAMEQYRIQAARPQRGGRRLIVGAGGDLRGPGAAGGGCLDDRQLHGARRFLDDIVGVEEEFGDDVEACAFGGADERDGMAEFAGQGERIQLAAAVLHLIGHIQQHQRGQPDGEDRRGQHQLAVHVGGVQDQENAVGLGHAGHLAGQHVDGHACIFGVSRERVDAGQIDEREVAAANGLHTAGVVLHGDAGIVGDLLTHPGKPVEEGGLARVRWADESDGAQARFLAGRRGRLFDWLKNGGMAAHTAVLAVSLRKMWLAVSLRRPTSMPSIR